MPKCKNCKNEIDPHKCTVVEDHTTCHWGQDEPYYSGWVVIECEFCGKQNDVDL